MGQPKDIASSRHQKGKEIVEDIDASQGARLVVLPKETPKNTSGGQEHKFEDTWLHVELMVLLLVLGSWLVLAGMSFDVKTVS